MKGGSMSELADYKTAFDAIPADIHRAAGTEVLDQSIAELAKFVPQHAAQTGGKRRRSTRRRRVGGMAPVDAPGMLLRPEDEPAAFLNPQWYNENMVNPHFQAPPSPFLKATGGAQRKSRKGRKAAKKSRKSMKGGKKSRKNHRKSAKKSHKSRKSAKKSRKSHRTH